MSKSLKIVLLGVSGFVALVALTPVVLMLFVDTNAYKSRLEATISDALGMPVRVDGRVGIGFFPGLRVTLDDLHIRNPGGAVASAKEARLGIDLLPLLRKEVRIRTIILRHPEISVERGQWSKLNVGRSGRPHALDLPQLSLAHGIFRYEDKQSGEEFAASDCSLDVHRLRRSDGQGTDVIKTVSFTAELACQEARRNNFTISDLKLTAKGEKGVFNLKPVTMRLFGAQGSGSIQADFADDTPGYHVRYSLPQFRIEEFFKTMSSQKVAEGPMDFSADLSMQGKTVKDMRHTAKGRISLHGENLTVNGIDLDQTFSRFESSQNFNLVDVAAFFIMGPVGVMVTKGYDFASIFQGSEGQSTIRKLVSNWQVKRGVAQAQDVAMATDKNRIALQGGLDFVNDRFDDVTVALIDAHGCVEVKQTIHGSFQKPLVEKPSILKSLTGPALELLQKGRDLFSGDECDVFYTGSVASPK